MYVAPSDHMCALVTPKSATLSLVSLRVLKMNTPSCGIPPTAWKSLPACPLGSRWTACTPCCCRLHVSSTNTAACMLQPTGKPPAARGNLTRTCPACTRANPRFLMSTRLTCRRRWRPGTSCPSRRNWQLRRSAWTSCIAWQLNASAEAQGIGRPPKRVTKNGLHSGVRSIAL